MTENHPQRQAQERFREYIFVKLCSLYQNFGQISIVLSGFVLCVIRKASFIKRLWAKMKGRTETVNRAKLVTVQVGLRVYRADRTKT